MNKAIVVANGYLCEDAIMQKFGEYEACTFKIGVNTSFKEKPEDTTRISNFYNCTYWGIHGKTFGEKAKKGSFVSITGEVALVPYKDKEGVSHPVLRINVMNAEFLPKSSTNTAKSLEPIDAIPV